MNSVSVRPGGSRLMISFNFGVGSFAEADFGAFPAVCEAEIGRTPFIWGRVSLGRVEEAIAVGATAL